MYRIGQASRWLAYCALAIAFALILLSCNEDSATSGSSTTNAESTEAAATTTPSPNPAVSDSLPQEHLTPPPASATQEEIAEWLYTIIQDPIGDRSLREATTPLAQQLKARILDSLEAGQTVTQVVEFVVESYGVGIVSSPCAGGSLFPQSVQERCNGDAVTPKPTSTSTDPPEVVSPTISAPPTSDPIVTKGSKLGELLSLIPNDDWFKQYIIFNEYQNRPVGGEQRAEVSGGRTAFADGTFGYSADQVHRDLDVGNKPRSIQIVEGKFDEGVIEEAFLNLGFEFTVVPGGEILFQGEDFEFSSGTGVLTFQNRVIIQEDRLIYPRVMDDGKSIVHPTRDESLLSDPDISALVESLSRHVVWSAFMRNQSLSVTASVRSYGGVRGTEYPIPPEYVERAERLEASITSAPLLNAYEAWAVALATDRAGVPYTLLAVVHSDETTAQANSSILEERLQKTEVFHKRRPWTDFFDSFEIKLDGRVLEVKMFGTDPEFHVEMTDREEFGANLLVNAN